MKSHKNALLILSLFPLTALADGGHVGGGDPCEDTFKEHSRYLQMQIRQDLPYKLNYEGDWNSERYKEAMLSLIDPIVEKSSNAPTIECKSKKITVDGVEKVCRSYSDKGRAKVECDREAFLGLSPRAQVRLVHHEWARLKGVEQTVGGDSDYFVSDQVIAILSPAVKENSGSVLIGYPTTYCTFEYQRSYFKDVDTGMTKPLEAALKKFGCVKKGIQSSSTNHLVITSDGDPEMYGSDFVDFRAVGSFTTVTNSITGKFLKTYGSSVAFFNVSTIGLGLFSEKAIDMNRYDRAAARAIKKSEAEMATKVGTLIR